MENILEIKNLCKEYNGFQLKNINMELPKGMIMGFIGENGAGKTTTIKSILNIINSEGSIKIFGKDIKLNEKEIKEEIGVVLDDSFLSEYYIKNNGLFLIAYDIKLKEIIGTIGLENRGKYGILKRFYVKEDYQKNGIGKKLYDTLETYTKEKTNINKIYLACGKVLEMAHNFYLKNGFNQIYKLDIKMHFSDDDDFFVKSIKR